jgi:hypothetical protein
MSTTRMLTSRFFPASASVARQTPPKLPSSVFGRSWAIPTTTVWGLLLASMAFGCDQSGQQLLQQTPAVVESWDAVYIGTTKVGHTQTSFASESIDGRRRIRIESHQHLEMARFGQKVKLGTHFECLESEEGVIQSFTCRTEAGPTPIVIRGELVDGTLRLTTTSQGKEIESSLPWDKSIRGFFATEQSLRRQPMKAGEKRRLKMLFPGLSQIQVIETILEAEGTEPTALLGESRDLMRIKNTVVIGDQEIETLCWTDEAGETWKCEIPGLRQVTYRTTRERALATGGIAEFDLGWDSIVRVSTPLPRAHQTERVVYRAKLSRRNPAEVFATGIGQRIEPIDATQARIIVTAVRPDRPEGSDPNVPNESDIAANSLIQCDDQQIKRLATQIAADEDDAWQVCLQMEKWVHKSIRSKNFAQGFATAADVAKTLEGDCTEHAVLLAALCRARGIPARVATGLIYSPVDQGYAFHMWNEAWVADRWVPLDGTLGLGGTGAAHLKLGQSNLSQENANSAVLAVIQVLNQLELEILEHQ